MIGDRPFDIRGIPFKEFVEFLFEREVAPESNENGEKEYWYYSAELVFEPREVAAHYLLLFSEPKFLLSRYSKAQLEEGFWAIQSPNLECGLPVLLWLEDLPFVIREDCVRSMFHLFERLFSAEPLETSANMWWDSLCYDWHCGNRSRARGGEDQLMQDVIFETLTKILTLDSVACQTAALHGFGHLHHPSTEQIIGAYIQGKPEIEPELKEYALAAARFTVR